MGASAEVELVLELLRRFSADGLDASLELVSDDAEFVIPASMSAEPDVYRGHDGARRYFAGFDGLMDELHWEPLETEQHGDVVIVWMLWRGRGVSSGIEVKQPGALNVWVAGGKVTRMHVHPDMDTARASLR
jgi:ketosteroid isomerase-like protein